MEFKNAIIESGINLSAIKELALSSGNELPESLPGLINYKIETDTTHNNDSYTVSQSFNIVAGGVSQEMNLNQKSLTFEESIKEQSEIIIKARPDEKSVKWEVNIASTK